jgi:hypothetical protein
MNESSVARSQRMSRSDTEAIRSSRTRLDYVDTQALSSESRSSPRASTQTLDRMLLRNDVIRGWAADPHPYSSAIATDAFAMISRTFAPPSNASSRSSAGQG